MLLHGPVSSLPVTSMTVTKLRQQAVSLTHCRPQKGRTATCCLYLQKTTSIFPLGEGEAQISFMSSISMSSQVLFWFFPQIQHAILSNKTKL